jgi:hypothetical protein
MDAWWPTAGRRALRSSDALAVEAGHIQVTTMDAKLPQCDVALLLCLEALERMGEEAVRAMLRSKPPAGSNTSKTLPPESEVEAPHCSIFEVGTLDLEKALRESDHTIDLGPVRAFFKLLYRWEVAGEHPSRATANAELEVMRMSMSELKLAILRGVSSNQRKKEQDEPPPIVCSQARLARFLDRSKNTANLLERLRSLGVVARFEWIGKRKARIWLSDPVAHQAALSELSGRGQT